MPAEGMRTRRPAQLLATGVEVVVEKEDRFISPGALGHNKFMVRTDKDGNPLTAWTGSTNWAPTGLCTQVNNGLLIDDADVARVYLNQWHELKRAKSEFPKAFVEGNSALKQKPEAVNADAHASWMIVVKLSNPSETSRLLDAAQYADLVK